MNGLPPENNPKSHPKPPSSTQQQPPKIHVAPSTVDGNHDPLPQAGKDQPLQPAGPSVDTRDDSPSIPSESGPPHLDNEALQYLNRIACSMEEIQVEMAAMTGELRGLLRRWGVASSTKK
ncbi:hypothetical protein BGW42_003825 [Actinomortierella wolfii]|nr:hypothetical protein BGW42_003825 [Actinomortierella wolfii]